MLTGHLQGWFGVRRELHLPMLIFLVLSMLYMAGWGVMFFSTTFRWTFTTWLFFAVMASVSVFLTFVGMILGIVCRLNFHKGVTCYRVSLPSWIVPLDRLNFVLAVDSNQQVCEGDVEKVAFPASEKPFAFFGKHKNDSTCKFGFKSSFDTTVHFVTFPQSALQRHSDNVETHSSHGPKSSISSTIKSSHSRKGSSNSNHSQQQRWIIE
jgi:hypothetical protein